MDKGKKYDLFIFSLLAISIIVIIPAQTSYASGTTIFSPHWLDYERDLGVPYFKYCGIFDSCFRNEIRLVPYLPLTTSQQNIDADENINVNPKIGSSSILPSKSTVNSMIPFQLPFP